jgi:rod shape-determining protein MreC
MESIFARYRNVIVLLAILMAQIVGLAMQVRRTNEGRLTVDSKDSASVRLLRLWAETLVSPPERIIHYSNLGVVGMWQNYVDLRHVRQQNKDLQQTIDRLRLEQAALLEDAKQGQRLEAMLDFQHRYIYSTVAAQAIGSSGSDQSRVFYLDKGSSDGLKPDMAVITASGIVGKVRDVFPHTAQVLMVNDQTSGAGVILETTRIRGILTGNASGQLEIVGILADERIKPGENVLTAGGDLIFPRGLPVGVVDKVVRDPERDAFIDILVKPSGNLDRLDEVLVITNTQPRFSTQDQHDIATSEAVKGAEAQAIKDQLKASEIKAEHLPGLIDPNLPPDQQPLNDNSNPSPVAHPPQALHPDRFTPGSNAAATAGVSDTEKPDAPGGANQQAQAPAAKASKPVVKSPVKAAPKPTQPSSGSAPGDTQTAKPAQIEKPQRNQ